MKTVRSLLFLIPLLLAGFAASVSAQQQPKEEVLPLRGTENLRADPTKVPAINVAVVPENVWVLDLSNGGRVRIQLRPDVAPAHVERIKTLTRQGFYNGLKFHRVIADFVAQGGDPTGTGNGGPGYELPIERTDEPFDAGILAMAKPDEAGARDNNGSQFFFVLKDQPTFAGKFTAFGRVTAGMDVLTQLTARDPQQSEGLAAGDRIESIEITET